MSSLAFWWTCKRFWRVLIPLWSSYLPWRVSILVALIFFTVLLNEGFEATLCYLVFTQNSRFSRISLFLLVLIWASAWRAVIAKIPVGVCFSRIARMKYWSCCKRKTSDFNTFLSQEGCTKGTHLWRKTDTVGVPTWQQVIAHCTFTSLCEKVPALLNTQWDDALCETLNVCVSNDPTLQEINCYLNSPSRIRKWSRVDLTGTRPALRSSSLSMPKTPSQSWATWTQTAPRWEILQVHSGISAHVLMLFFSSSWLFLSLQLNIHVIFEGEKEFEQKISLWGVSTASLKALDALCTAFWNTLPWITLICSDLRPYFENNSTIYSLINTLFLRPSPCVGDRCE